MDLASIKAHVARYGYIQNGGYDWLIAEVERLNAIGRDTCLEISYDLRGKELDKLTADLSRVSAERDELTKEAELSLDFYREKGRVIVTRDGNAVQRLGASAEIAIMKAEKERDAARFYLGTIEQSAVELKTRLAAAQVDMAEVVRDRVVICAERDELRGQLDSLKAILQEICNTLHAYSQDNKHAEVTRLIQERDTWKARYLNKTLRFNAVRARAKVDMARLAGEVEQLNAQIKVEQDKNNKYDSQCLVHAKNAETDLSAANSTISCIRTIVGSQDVVRVVEKMAEELTRLRLEASKGDTGRGDK